MKTIRVLGTVALMALAGNAIAEEHVIKGVVTNWVPLVTYAKPGDVIKFEQMTGHDSESIEGMIPEDAEHWHSGLGAEGFSVTLEKEGAYIYKCNPHITTGMVGAIVVGDGAPSNLDALESNIDNVKVGKNMVERAIRHMKQELQKAGRIQ